MDLRIKHEPYQGWPANHIMYVWYVSMERLEHCRDELCQELGGQKIENRDCNVQEYRQ